MTYLEKPSSGKALLDDTVPLTAVIEASQTLQSHTVSVAWEQTLHLHFHYYTNIYLHRKHSFCNYCTMSAFLK